MQSKVRLAAIEQDMLAKSTVHQQSIEAVREKMQERSENVERTYELHLAQQDQVQHQRTAKVFDKYNSTLKKLNRVNKDLMSKTMILRGKNEERFSKRDFQYSQILQDKHESDRAKLQRSANKNRQISELFQQKSIQLSQKIEEARLRRNDAHELYQQEIRKKQQFQDYVLKNQFMTNALNQEAAAISRSIYQQAKLQSNSEERLVTDQTNLVRTMKTKTDEQALQELKQRKIFEESIYDRKRKATEISEYQRRDAEKKYNDIRSLLVRMNVPV